MSANAETRERVILDRLKERYERQGYVFYSHPPAAIVPEFLGSYRPDAIAMKPDDGVILEIKARGTLEPRRDFGKVAEIVARQNGWRFDIFVDDQSPEPVRIAPSTTAQIGAQVVELERLADSGQNRVAFILGWALLEAAARLAASRQESAWERPHSPAETVQFLEMSGAIDPDPAARLRKLADLRNAVVHGDLSVEVEQSALQLVVRCLKEIVVELDREHH